VSDDARTEVRGGGCTRAEAPQDAEAERDRHPVPRAPALDEEQAIAGLLHDAVEDAGGSQTLELIRSRFGDAVATIVEGCTDAFEVPKPPWRDRKERYIDSIAHKPVRTLLVSACDKLDNARAIAVDLRREGAATLQRFAGGTDTLWYYAEIAKALGRAGQGTNVAEVVRELAAVVREIEVLARPPEPVAGA
jgi:GTP pyrophosphokinase